MAVRLRPHHLLCMLTYVGKGYSRSFVENYDALAARIGAGEPIEIVDGPDDVCRPLLGTAGCHCRRASVRRRDADAALSVGALIGGPVAAGTRIVPTPALLAAMRRAFAEGTPRAACAGCRWADLCSAVAAGGYRDVRVSPSAAPREACS